MLALALWFGGISAIPSQFATTFFYVFLQSFVIPQGPVS
jgi:uncharacterized membrane protein YtjA (UPF0391 family)